MVKSYVFDTSAILTLFDNEEGADTVAELLHLAIHERITIFVSAISMVEFRYRLIRQHHEHAFVDKKMNELYDMPIIVVDFNQALIEQSAIYKSTAKMSFADACIAGTAKHLGAILVHKDPEYQAIAHDIKQLVLPFKPKTNQS
ncbi:Uncharacterized protein conserved in bacteria [Moraxella lacunata]|uniref:Uncharacterized protein conserved in bacteria n=1 Tax=Moraxella lacunata TaxID=477 RepID=A0A1B8Q4S5_MORLA|nr:type II toxin-antitoxin system VapC family toxin [Moraxella lacunata]MDI4506464.1 type II toxin-antitoxin system VapC family toxin [Moraxella lacunata]OBX64373.1 hypothetical protein A9Z63_03165 [Moraxella lacunata]OBX64669.1 hypothetical protein A9309_03965 [Moraxella lacunata]STZ00956.1 Uncharacterized protein conserved in bacteria [Moraxella lacunata]